MKFGILSRLSCVLCMAVGLPLLAEVPSLIAIRNARIVPVSGPVIEKGTVVMRDGLISDVGASVTIPAGAWIIEGEGLTVYPGLIDAISSWGIPEAASAAPAATTGRGGGAPATPAQPAPVTAPATQPVARAMGPEDRPSTQSWLRAADLVRPTDRRLDAARTAGYTTAVTFPKQGIVAGNGAVVNLGAARANQMVVQPSAGLYLTLQSASPGGGFPNSLFGVMAYLRQLWIDAAYYQQVQQRYAKNPTGQKRPDYDRSLEGVLAAPRILLPATTAVQIDRMIRFGGELKTPLILYGVHDGYRTADLLKKANIPVVVNLRWPAKSREADPDDEESYRTIELRANAPSTPAALAKAGVKFAFSADGVETPREAIRAVKKSIDAGLARDQAIRALTLSAAEIYGVSDRLGSIDRGKIANLVVFKGDIFDERPQMQMIFIDGVKYDPAPEQPQTPTGFPGRSGGGAPPAEIDQDGEVR
jgi:imidazolonepropionase-like amidohydrolase